VAEDGSRCPDYAAVGEEGGETVEQDGGGPGPETDMRALVLAAVLGGAWELPPDFLLKASSGACRPYQYTQLSALGAEWQPAAAAAADGSSLGSARLLQEHTCAELERWIPASIERTSGEVDGGGCTYESGLARFWVHRLTLAPAVRDPLMARLRELALRRAAEAVGIEISNAGGSWHSGRDLFRWTNEPAVGTLARVCLHALHAVEEKEEAEAAASCRQYPCPRDHAKVADAENEALAALQHCDAWLNVSRDTQGW
jgi:hypothetical protein